MTKVTLFHIYLLVMGCYNGYYLRKQCYKDIEEEKKKGFMPLLLTCLFTLVFTLIDNRFAKMALDDYRITE